MEKLIKALEALKVMQPLGNQEEANFQNIARKKDQATSKKEKIAHASTIADTICMKSFRSNPDFLKYLGIAIETFLWCCDDEDSDVRLMADECLNRTIKTLLDTYLSRLQVELFKEIKKDGQARSLRAALSRFADLSPLIRSQKCRPYCYNLMPCLVKICQRPQEPVQETLAIAISKIMPVLGRFAVDNEIKTLVEAYLPNLTQANSAAIRRTAATSLVTICQYSRRPPLYLKWLLILLLKNVIPIQTDQPVSVLLGILLCLRHLVPHLRSSLVHHHSSSNKDDIITDSQILQVYELLVFYVQHSNHNVTASALEALQPLLRDPPEPLLQAILSPSGINQSLIYLTLDTLTRFKSQMSLIGGTNPEDESLLVDEMETSGLLKMGSQNSIDEVSLRTDNGMSLNGEENHDSKKFDSLPRMSGRTNTLETAALKKGASDEKLLVYEEDLDQAWQQTSSLSESQSSGLVMGALGGFTDSDIPLKYLCRLLSGTFLLTGERGGLVSDKNVRVSVKALALNCLSSAVSLYPPSLFLSLPIKETADSQRLWDILLFTSHPDPHLKGNAALLLGTLIEANLRTQTNGSWPLYPGSPPLNTLITNLEQVVQDSSSVASKLALQAVRLCISSLLHSQDAPLALNLLETVLAAKDNSYWLVRVEILKLLKDLPFALIYFIEQEYITKSSFQERALQLIVTFLADEDYRVRQAMADCLSCIIPKLFYSIDHPYQDTIIFLAKEMTEKNLQTILPLSSKEGPLARIIVFVSQTLLTSTSKHLTFGCCEALYHLVEKYPPAKFSSAWSIICSETTRIAKSANVLKHQSSLSAGMPVEEPEIITTHYADLLSHLVSLLTTSSHVLDLQFHQQLMTVLGRILFGVCTLKKPDPTNVTTEWSTIQERHFVPLIEKVLVHIFRILNAFSHVLEDQTPIQARPVLPSLPVAPSPIKRKPKNPKEDSATTISGDKNVELDEKKSNTSKLSSVGMGQFHTLPLYVRLWEVLKASHASYHLSMDVQSSEKLCSLLKASLDSLSLLLDLASLQEMSKVSAELLTYLKSVMCMEPCSTVITIRQLLKCLFGTNLSSNIEESHPPAEEPPSKTRSSHLGLYHTVLAQPSQCLSARLTSDSSSVSSKIAELQKQNEQRFSIRGAVRGDKNSLASYIRQFETVVIKALKLYTMTSNMMLQCHVLVLLAELVQLRVNYCLLDSDQIFFKFVVKQVDNMEDNQIIFTDGLIPLIFDFLVLLSYEKYHSKAIIGVPKILHLCEGLLASGKPPEQFAVPALRPLVEDLFVVRGKVDAGRELDTQREVLISVLLRLVAYRQVQEMFLLVLVQYHQEGEDKWKKLSRQIVDSVLPLLVRQLIDADSLSTLHTLFETVSPSVFRPVDILLKALFTLPQPLEVGTNLERWLCLVLCIVRIFLAQGREEVILTRLGDMDPPSSLPRYGAVPTSFRDTHLEDETPEHTLLKFLLHTVNVSVQVLHHHVCDLVFQKNDPTRLASYLSQLLLYLTHMFQSGSFRQMAVLAMAEVKEQLGSPEETVLSEINQKLAALTSSYPTLVLQWANILALLNSDNLTFWRPILKRPSKQEVSVSHTPAHMEMIRRGGVILLCDYVCENLNDIEQMTWLLVNHVNELVKFSYEVPVSDFISAIHRNPAVSGLFIQAINARCDNFSKPSFVKKTLQCLEVIHPSQSGNLVILLVDRFLCSQHLITAKMCESLACRRLEYMISDPTSDYLSVQEISRIIQTVNNLPKRHDRLVTLLHKLETTLEPQQDHPLTKLPAPLSPLTVNKTWYVNIVHQHCQGGLIATSKCAQLLQPLGYNNLLTIMQDAKFHLPILTPCFQLSGTDSILYKAAAEVLVSYLDKTLSDMSSVSTADENKTKLWNFNILPAIVEYLKTMIPSDVSLGTQELLAKFSVVFMEGVRWTHINQEISWSLELLSSTLKIPSLNKIIGRQENSSWVERLIALLYHLVNSFIDKDSLPCIKFPHHLVDEESDNFHAHLACSQITELISWMELHPEPQSIPQFILKPLRFCIVGNV